MALLLVWLALVLVVEAAALVLFTIYFVIPLFRGFVKDAIEVRRSGIWRSLPELGMYTLFILGFVPAFVKGVKLLYDARKEFDLSNTDTLIKHLQQLQPAAYPRLTRHKRYIQMLLRDYYLEKDHPYYYHFTPTYYRFIPSHMLPYLEQAFQMKDNSMSEYYRALGGICLSVLTLCAFMGLLYGVLRGWENLQTRFKAYSKKNRPRPYVGYLMRLLEFYLTLSGLVMALDVIALLFWYVVPSVWLTRTCWENYAAREVMVRTE